MTPDIIGAVFVVAAALVTAVLGRKVNNASQKVANDPNESLIATLAYLTEQANAAVKLSSQANSRADALEADLHREKEAGKERDKKLDTLHDENRELNNQLSILRRALDGWEAWHRLLISKWDEYRQNTAPPDAPIRESGE